MIRKGDDLVALVKIRARSYIGKIRSDLLVHSHRIFNFELVELATLVAKCINDFRVFVPAVSSNTLLSCFELIELTQIRD